MNTPYILFDRGSFVSFPTRLILCEVLGLGILGNYNIMLKQINSMDNYQGDDLHARLLRRLEERHELQRVRNLVVPALPPGRHRHVLLHCRLPVPAQPDTRGQNAVRTDR